MERVESRLGTFGLEKSWNQLSRNPSHLRAAPALQIHCCTHCNCTVHIAHCNCTLQLHTLHLHIAHCKLHITHCNFTFTLHIAHTAITHSHCTLHTAIAHCTLLTAITHCYCTAAAAAAPTWQKAALVALSETSRASSVVAVLQLLTVT